MGSEERGLEEGKLHQEPPRPPCLSGLPWASRILAADIEKTTTIFKSFHETSIRNLLFLEARVVALEDVQINLDREDVKIYGEEIEMKEVAASWEQFALLASPRPSRWGKKIPDCALRQWQMQRNKWQSHFSNTSDIDKMNDKRWSDTSDSTLVTNKTTPQSPVFPPSTAGTPKFSGSTGKSLPRETPTKSGLTARPKSASGLSRIEEKAGQIQNVDPQGEPNSGSSGIEGKTTQIQNVNCDETLLEAIQDRWEVAIALKEAIEEYREYISNWGPRIR